MNATPVAGDNERNQVEKVKAERDRASFIARLESLIPPRGETAFARQAGISPGGLRGAKKNGNPGREMLVRIARTADVSVEWLATGEGPMRRQGIDEKGENPGALHARAEQQQRREDLEQVAADVTDHVVAAFLWLREIAAAERLELHGETLKTLLRLAVSLPRIPENEAILASVMRQMCR